MNKKIKNYFFSNEINNKKIIYGFFSKQNGHSSKNYSSLNCSLSSNDDKKMVKKNIEKAKKILGLENKKIKFINQSHSSKVEIINNYNLNYVVNADGSITTDKNIALAILTADCAPIFIFDKKFSLICSLHAGWKGCLNSIIHNAVKDIAKINRDKHKLIAVVGPCLGKKNFEVGEDFKNMFVKQDSNCIKFFNKKINQKKLKFDMRGLINYQLKKSKVGKIINVNMDTYSQNNLFFSHRYSSHQGNGPTGRMINLIGFSDSD